MRQLLPAGQLDADLADLGGAPDSAAEEGTLAIVVNSLRLFNVFVVKETICLRLEHRDALLGGELTTRVAHVVVRVDRRVVMLVVCLLTGALRR